MNTINKSMSIYDYCLQVNGALLPALETSQCDLPSDEEHTPSKQN